MQAAKSYFSDERIAANEAATARAKADAEIAREGAEAAHAKALEAELALENTKRLARFHLLRSMTLSQITARPFK